MPKTVELNEPSAPACLSALRQHLITASNELYLYELQSTQNRRPVPEAVRRAHSAVRAELRRVEAELEA